MSTQESIDILLVEDNRDIAENIIFYLQKKGHRVDTIYSAEKALLLLQKNDYDLFIFDVMLPGMDGFSLADIIRSKHKVTTPILFLTARDTLDDKLDGFSVGADDYLTKPFDLEELEVRMMAIYRRAKGLIAQTLTLGDWTVDEKRFEIAYKKHTIAVTKIGFKIFKALMLSCPDVLSRSELEKNVWGDDPPDSDSLRSHIFTLRKSISAVCEKSAIETVHGVGFRMRIE